MDVDALFWRDPRALYEALGADDVAMRIRPGRLEPWNQFNACIVGASAGSHGEATVAPASGTVPSGVLNPATGGIYAP